MKKKVRKGFSIAFIALAFTAIFLGMLIPIFFLRIHLVGIVNIENKVDNVQLTLLTLISSTHDGKPIQKIIGEHIALGIYPDIDKILSTKLDKMIECYELRDSKGILVKSQKPDCNPSKFTAETRIPLPFGEKLSEEISLVID